MMVMQRATGGFMQKMAAQMNAAFERHKADDTEYSSFGELPPGINNGVAQLVKLEFKEFKEGTKNAGQWMFYAEGRVIRPVSAVDPRDKETVRTEGLSTKLFEPMFDTPDRTRKTFDDHVAHIMNELRKLGLDTSRLKGDQLEAGMAALVKAAPYFKFRTYQMPPRPGDTRDPMVNHAWDGKTDYVVDTSGHVNDSTSSQAVTSRQTDSVPSSNGQHQKTSSQFDEFGDVKSLVEAANLGDESAQVRLKDMALRAGRTEQELIDAEDWETVGKMALGGESTDGDEGPEVGATVYYRPLSVKTGRPVKGRVECQVIAVNVTDQTVDLKSMVDGKMVYRSVPWPSVESA